MEERLVEIESKAAFLDHTIEELNDVIINQQQQIDQLEKNLGRMREQLRLIMSALPEEALRE